MATPTMKILVAAFRLDADRTSAGICCTNLVRALDEIGHEVTVLTPPWYTNSVSGQVAEVSFQEVAPAGSERIMAWMAQAVLPESDPVKRRVIGKFEALLNYTTGRGSTARGIISAWRHALRRALDRSHGYDFAILCSAGADFSVPLAMLEEFPQAPPLPFVTHYHDPFPTSLYPPPYQQRIPFISRFQEAEHEKLLRLSPALSFPSSRLRDWVLGDSADLRAKSVCLPHPALGPPAPAPAALSQELHEELELPEPGFVVVHTGTLLSPRSPFPLLDAWQKFVARDAERERRACLVHVGSLHRSHRTEQWQHHAAQPTTRLLDRRIPYRDAMSLCRRASAAIVLEAPAQHSPFFPGKLADLLWLDQVILGLSPRESVVADALGTEHPLLAEPDDIAAITASLEHLWCCWQQGTLDSLRPSRTGSNLGSLDQIGGAVEALRILFEHAR